MSQIQQLENDWWRWRILCWVRDVLLFMWVSGLILMIADERGKGCGFILVWLGLAGWPIIMVLGWRWQEKAKDVERQYRPYIRCWRSWQAFGWIILGLALVFYLRTFAPPIVFLFNRQGADNSVEFADGRLIVVSYTPAVAGSKISYLGEKSAGLPYLNWSSVNWEITNNKGGLRGETTMRHFDGRTLRCDYAIVPLVALLPIVLIWPIAWGGRIRSIERRRKANQCPNCGYDLRETPHQCPECGQAAMRLTEDAPDESLVL